MSQLEDIRNNIGKQAEARQRFLTSERFTESFYITGTSESIILYQKMAETYKDKLKAAEKLCGELMDANDELKREVKDMEHEIEELHDNFRWASNEASDLQALKRFMEQEL